MYCIVTTMVTTMVTIHNSILIYVNIISQTGEFQYFILLDLHSVLLEDVK